MIKPKIDPNVIQFRVIKTHKGKMGTIDSIVIKKHPRIGPASPK